MTAEERYYDTKWRYENHFKTDEMKEQLIADSHAYIKRLEETNGDLHDRVKELEGDLEELTCEDWEL
ncbi:hypothetical protein [Staphylococcus aureus]|uniref:hypothetical protein n=1 Tax=Staphylococcus aureus TaxID=1280 RepID=UPI0018E93A21|nr:hypothetical protein [Staphylococcus aureus]MBJ6141291.1 hypothetical protein [Staphylococcus aureus]MBJ6151967.1 hypothetical protein [Staphylococcus aureus]MBJ6154174.1 hypothetical protein [Staphylococcus aureus]MBJ6156961.1 hypothetical protein [Staphylococcus aureus]MBJ6159643.1 hypothetical protein [Staphylococcus aureus]